MTMFRFSGMCVAKNRLSYCSNAVLGQSFLLKKRLLAGRRRPAGVGRRSGFNLSAASRDLLNPLTPPGGRLEGIREILCLVHDLSVTKLHNTHCVCWSPLVGDRVFRDPEITASENSPDVEARRLARMVTSQGLQIVS